MISYLKVCRLEWNFPVKGMTTLTSVARKWDAHAHWNTWPRRPSASAGYEVYVLKKIKLRLKRLHISIAIFHIVAHQKIWCKDIISYQLFSIFMFISEIWPFSYFTLGHFFSFHIGSLESSFAISVSESFGFHISDRRCLSYQTLPLVTVMRGRGRKRALCMMSSEGPSSV